MQGRRELGEKVFRVLRAANVGFSLRLWLVRRREIRRYAPTCNTVVTAFTIPLFKVEIFFITFLRGSLRFFYPQHFYANWF